MEATVEKTWKPVVAGILNIVAGALNLIFFLCVLIAIIAISSDPFILNSAGVRPDEVVIAQTVLVTTAVFSAVMGIVPLIAGIYEVQRKKWGLALAGSIVAIFGMALLGIASTVFTALSRQEFE